MTINNTCFYALGSYKRWANALNQECLKFLKQGIWPMSVRFLKKELIEFVFKLQNSINLICLQDSGYDKTLSFFECFCFSLIIRVYNVESMRTYKLQKILDRDYTKIKDVFDFAICMKLVNQTHPKYIHYNSNFKIRYIKMAKGYTNKAGFLGILSLTERVIQLLFFTLLDPMIETMLPEHFYSFRRGRSAHNAIAFLYKNILLSNTNNFYLISIDVYKYFEFISHKYIIDNFPFPIKFKKLLWRWICNTYTYESSKTKRFYSGVPQDSILGSLICNFVLARLLNHFFRNFFSKFTETNLKENTKIMNTDRFIVSYANSMMFQVYSKEEIAKTLFKLEKVLTNASLQLNPEKTNYYDLSKKIKFDWLGFTFLSIPSSQIKFTKLVSTRQRYVYRKKKLSVTLWLYLSNQNFTKIKKDLKWRIKLLKYKRFIKVLLEINSILRNVTNYFRYAVSAPRLSYLQYFIEKLFWRVLIDKYRYHGIRRPRWVYKTFLKYVPILDKKNWFLYSDRSITCPLMSSRSRQTIWYKLLNTTTMVSTIQPMQITLLSSALHQKSIYIERDEFDAEKFRIHNLKTDFKTVGIDERLYKKQKGICFYCNQYMNILEGAKIDLYYKTLVTINQKQIKRLRKLWLFYHHVCHKKTYYSKKK